MSQLNDSIVDNITKILDHFNIPHHEYNNRISLACPIHGSDNPESLSISLKDNSRGVYKCWSNHCEEEVIERGGKQVKRGKFVTSLIAELLKIQHNKEFSQWEAVKWCSKFLNVQIDETNKNNYDYVKMGRILCKERVLTDGTVTRNFVRSSLKIPSKYFIDRGFEADTLDRYDVGMCSTPKKKMYMRVVVPVYDDNYRFMVGCVGRSINSECPQCGMYHFKNKPCPTNPIEKKWSEKWINSDQFNCSNYLYNYWFARDNIAKTGVAILVEGQGDVWRLEEAGYRNGLGIFGSYLNDQQKIALDALNAFNLIIATDNDEVGLKARETIKEKCERYYNLHFLNLPKKDIGELSKDEIKSLLDPILEKI
jgi:5S rRNA maturation endonuclease (ribonuclease M5)